jgi:hypothetical protein
MSHYQNDCTPDESAMKAFIIYDDFSLTVKASFTLQRVAHHRDVKVRWDIRPWRVDVLQLPPTSDEALVDASDVHLIVFAGRCALSLPTGLAEWLERWAMNREIPDAALAVMVGENADVLPVPPASGLARFAVQYGLSFIYDAAGAVEETSEFFAGNLRRREVRASPSLERNILGPICEPCRGWGINE